MPSVFQQREAEAERAHAKAAIAVHMHMIAAKKAAMQRAKQLAAAKKHVNPQEQQAQTMHHAARQENLLEANMHERGPYGWLGSLWSDLSHITHQAEGDAISTVKTAEHVAGSYVADVTQGSQTYHVTPAGAYTNAQAMAGKLTPGEQQAVAKGEVITENLLPSQVSGQVAEMQSEYGHNAVEQFLFGMGNSQGNLFANPISSAQQNGIFSSQFAKSLGISVGTVLLEAAPIPGGQAAADVATTAGKAGLSIVGQRGIRAGIGAAVGAASGLGLGLMNGAKGNHLWEDIGIGAASGAVIGLTSSPSGSLLRSISEDTAIENPSIFTSDTVGHITGDEGSTESITTATATKTIPKFGRFGYYQGTEEVSGEYTIGSHITPISSSEENGLNKEYNGVSASISRTVKIGNEEPATSSDVVEGVSLRLSKPSISLTNTEEGTEAESGTELNIINTKSLLSGEEKTISTVDKYDTESNENDLLRGSSTYKNGINGEDKGTATFRELSNTAISKKWLDTLTLTQKSPDEVLQGLNDLKAGAEESAQSAEDNIPAEVKTWLDNERLNNQITNDERANEYSNPDEDNGEETKTATATKTTPGERTINTIIRNDWDNLQTGSIIDTVPEITRGINIGIGIASGSLLRMPTMTGTKSKSITSITTPVIITKPITKSVTPPIGITKPITKPITKTQPKSQTTTSTQTTTTTNTTTLSTTPTDNIIPLKTTGGLLLPIRHKKEPAQDLFPFYGRIGRRPKLRAKKSYFAFPDLLNENEYQFMTGKRAHALKITPQNAKVYNRMFSQTLGMNILTQEQLERKARKTKATKKRKIF